MESILESLKVYKDELSGITALLALLISFLSIIFTVISLYFQRRHNFKSLTPILNISISDYENRIGVTLKNTGVGPLIIESFTATNGEISQNNIISLMPSLQQNIFWTTFYDNFVGVCIPHNQSITVIQLDGDSNNSDYAQFRNEVRKYLSKLSITIKYKDIYDRSMPIKEKKLEWFGRHFQNEIDEKDKAR